MNETIEILHHALRPALTGLAKVIPRRVVLPVLGHVRVTRDRAGQVFLSQDGQGQVWVGGDVVGCIQGAVTL